ncbi:MAG TPA: MFS transporter [Pyrinomonadaceae bacterium]|jgi:MFS family permease
MVANALFIRSLSSRVRRFTAWQPLAVGDFRMLWLGQSVSILGDQFYLVALPWLVLYLTGSGLVLGAVMLTATVPRVVFQLVGGATSDRISPHKLMLASSVFRALVCGLLTVLVLLGVVKLWHIYVIAAAFGTADAFFAPAFRSFIPTVLDKENLIAGNALLQGSSVLTKLIGPSLAGLLIPIFGTGMAFGLDTGSFIFVAACLLMIRRTRLPERVAEQGVAQADKAKLNMLSSIREGISYTLKEPVLRSLIIIISAVEFAFAGPFTVGLASLADVKFATGPTAFGAMLSTLGGGLLLGTFIAGSVKAKLSMKGIVIPCAVALSVGLTLLGLVPNVVWACIVIAAVGVVAGFLQVVVAAWLQTCSAPHMLGRVMSVVMLCAYGLTPLSYVLTGALTQISVSFMFIVTGSSLLVVLAICALGWAGRTLETQQPQ